jgi:adenine/guanine phosphoribosyltransferase-like PRPP-binding protein
MLSATNVLLIDDTWTTGSNAQSAAFALKDAGASTVGFVVIGRYVAREYEDHGARLDALPRPFRWETCAHHDGPPTPEAWRVGVGR